jgi:hypothetical protein
VKYFILHNNIDRLLVRLKGCAIYWVNKKWFDIYCAVWKRLHRLWTALRNIASVSVGRSCSEHLREWIITATKPKSDERKFILERIELYHSLPALWNVKSKDYSNRINKMNNTNIRFSNIGRDFRMPIKISWLKNLNICVLTSEQNWRWLVWIASRMVVFLFFNSWRNHF